MLKFLPITLVIIFMVGAFAYLRFFYISKTPDKNPLTANPSVSNINLSSNSNSDKSLEDRVKILEDSVTLVAQYVGTSNSKKTTPTPTNLESRIAALENSLSALQKQVTAIQTQVSDLKNSSTSTTSTSKTPLFIPLGSGGNFSDKNWANMNGYRVEIDSGDYPGYTSMQLEVSLKMNQAVGSAQARLYNLTDNSAVGSSNVSVSSSDASSYLYSSGFKITTGKKNYVLQVQSTENTETQLYSARIKVNF